MGIHSCRVTAVDILLHGVSRQGNDGNFFCGTVMKAKSGVPLLAFIA
jgi:hypothetical protein